MELNEKLEYFFENHPLKDEVHSTADGTLFMQKQDALAHAQGLENSMVQTHKREPKLTAEAIEKPVKEVIKKIIQEAVVLPDDNQTELSEEKSNEETTEEPEVLPEEPKAEKPKKKKKA